VNSMEIELTLENLKVIKLWHFLAMKDREATLGDTQTVTKINAFAIAKREQEEKRKRQEHLFKNRGGCQ